MTVRIWVLCLISAIGVAAVVLHGPISQPAGYHHFADQRALLGIPNFGNVISNLPFLVIGLLGLRDILSRRPQGTVPGLERVYACVFVGIILVAFGSGYYHLAPSDNRLAWDRLPMTITFMALFAMIVGEHVDGKAGLRLAAPLTIRGVASVWYWRAFGDLRPYVIVQFLPLLLVPAIMLSFRSRLSGVGYIWGLIAAYVLAKFLEYGDAAILSLGGIVSGHTLKHLTAAFGMYVLLLAVRRRRLTLDNERHCNPITGSSTIAP